MRIFVTGATGATGALGRHRYASWREGLRAWARG